MKISKKCEKNNERLVILEKIKFSWKNSELE